MIPGCFGLPTMEGKTALGASSPAKPAFKLEGREEEEEEEKEEGRSERLGLVGVR